MDFSVAPAVAEIDNCIKTASAMLHTSHDNAIFFRYPAQYQGLSQAGVIQLQRRVEDMLLKNNVNMDMEVVITFTVTEQHASERRPLKARGRLCISGSLPGSSVWENSIATVDGIN